MPRPLRVLMIEDSDFDAELLLAMLERGGYKVTHLRVETAEGLRKALEQEWDIVIADYNLPQFDALAALEIVKASGKDIPFIIVSGGIGESTAVAAMKAGAHDYLMKGNLARLVPVVERELREAENRRSKRATEEALKDSELRYRLLWETATDAVLLLNPDAMVEFANPAVKAIFGYDQHELIGKSVDVLQPFFESLDPEINWKRFIRLAHGGSAPGAIEATGKHKDGREICVEIVFSALQLGPRRLFVCFIRDITERKKTERELMANQEQFRVAHEIQQHLFPKASPRLDSLDIAGASYPAEATGGDYFDYLPMLNGCTGIVVGDVTGHGIGPALLMAETRAYLRILARNRADAAEILYRTNLVLAEDVGAERYVTLMFLKLDPSAKKISYANAGHIPGYILDKEGGTKQILKRTGPPLGLRSDAAYTASGDLELVEGDLILLLTDGFEEALSPDEEFFGMQRVLDHIKAHREESAEEIVKSLYQNFQQFTEGATQLDDLTIVVVKVGG
ncbi:MAG TPA: SpoIIE family protein phosphatase [Verrucomicrobiae bacterium]|nr:SpoIIE family protein phosphatase [Verrucomicrobiae bacterium]